MGASGRAGTAGGAGAGAGVGAGAGAGAATVRFGGSGGGGAAAGAAGAGAATAAGAGAAASRAAATAVAPVPPWEGDGREEDEELAAGAGAGWGASARRASTGWGAADEAVADTAATGAGAGAGAAAGTGAGAGGRAPPLPRVSFTLYVSVLAPVLQRTVMRVSGLSARPGLTVTEAARGRGSTARARAHGQNARGVFWAAHDRKKYAPAPREMAVRLSAAPSGTLSKYTTGTGPGALMASRLCATRTRGTTRAWAPTAATTVVVDGGAGDGDAPDGRTWTPWTAGGETMAG
jgi:hypothetical protein